MRRIRRPEQPVSLFDVIAACGEGIRLELLIALRRGPADVGELAERRSLSTAGVSYHLRELAKAGLVSYQACGKRHLYTLTDRVSFLFRADSVVLQAAPDDGCEYRLAITQQVAAKLGLKPWPDPPVVVVLSPMGFPPVTVPMRARA